MARSVISRVLSSRTRAWNSLHIEAPQGGGLFRVLLGAVMTWLYSAYATVADARD